MSVPGDSKNKGGRPPKEARGGLTKILGFRLRPALREQLEEAAKRESRSISEECEYRLHRSFDREAAVVEVFGHSAHRRLILALCNAIRMVEEVGDEAGDKLQAYAAVIAVVEGLAGGKSAKEIMKEAAVTGFQAGDAADAVLAFEMGRPLTFRSPLPAKGSS